VGGGALNDVKGDFELRIREQFRVASSGVSFVVGDKRAPGTMSTYVTGAHSMGASEEITIRSEAGIVLTCGASSLVITPSGVKIKATKLELEAAEGLTAVSSKGAALQLTEDAKLAADTIAMFAPNGSFTLDDKGARLSGNLLFLDAAPEANKSDPMKDPDVKTKPLHVQLSDIDFKAYANLHFHLLVDGSLIEGITDGEGMVDKEVPETAKRATILLWPTDYPKGQSLKWDLDLVDAIPPPETVRGAKTRLKNLGYYTGPLNDDEGEDFREAILELQRDAGVSATGKLDPDTIDQLEKYHTS